MSKTSWKIYILYLLHWSELPEELLVSMCLYLLIEVPECFIQPVKVSVRVISNKELNIVGVYSLIFCNIFHIQ